MLLNTDPAIRAEEDADERLLDRLAIRLTEQPPPATELWRGAHLSCQEADPIVLVESTRLEHITDVHDLIRWFTAHLTDLRGRETTDAPRRVRASEAGSLFERGLPTDASDERVAWVRRDDNGVRCTLYIDRELILWTRAVAPTRMNDFLDALEDGLPRASIDPAQDTADI